MSIERWAATADVGMPGSARFAEVAIARVGKAIALAVDELVEALFEAVLPWEAVGGGYGVIPATGRTPRSALA